MSQIGSFLLLLALALSAYSFLFGAIALFRRDTLFILIGETARRAGIASFVAVLLAGGILVNAAFSNDFSIAYIFQHSNRDLPGPYKFATLWSGQEGSLLFWALLLSGYGFVLRIRHKTDERLFAVAPAFRQLDPGISPGPRGGGGGNRTRVLRRITRASPSAVRSASTRPHRSRRQVGVTGPVTV